MDFSTNIVRNPNFPEPIVESPETPIYIPTSPNTTDIPRTGYHFNAYGWEPPNNFDNIEPTGCGTNDEVEISYECYSISREEFEAGRGRKEEVVNPSNEVGRKEVEVEEFDLMCHETIEDLEVSDVVQVDIAYDGDSTMSITQIL